MVLFSHGSVGRDVDDGLGKVPWSFLREVVPDAAGDVPVLVLAGKPLCIGTGIGVRSAIRIALECNGRHLNGGEFGEPLFELVVLRLALSESEPPTVVMDDDADVIRVVEGRRAAIERGVIEVPLRRGELPDELREIAPVFVVTVAATFRGEVKLI